VACPMEGARVEAGKFECLKECTRLTDLTLRLGPAGRLRASHLQTLSELPRLYVLTTDDCFPLSSPDCLFPSASLRLWKYDSWPRRACCTVSQEVWERLQERPKLTVLIDGQPARLESPIIEMQLQEASSSESVRIERGPPNFDAEHLRELEKPLTMEEWRLRNDGQQEHPPKQCCTVQ
jgi:hypothetical protein